MVLRKRVECRLETGSVRERVQERERVARRKDVTPRCAVEGDHPDASSPTVDIQAQSGGAHPAKLASQQLARLCRAGASPLSMGRGGLWFGAGRRRRSVPMLRRMTFATGTARERKATVGEDVSQQS